MARRYAGRLDLRRRIRVVAFVMAFQAASASAQIVTDGTMGPEQALGGLDVEIPASLGTRDAGNLFHSFRDFNIAANGSATFTGPGDIGNVISRVTGGNESNINGLLRSTIGSAGFFFINPAGVTFGSNASVDVPGAFHVSTADQIRFPDGGVFDASNPANTVLSVADPSAFGFLNAGPKSITVAGAALAVPAGETLSLIGGDVTIAGGLVEAPSGVINLASVSSPGEVSLAPGGLGLTGFDALGSITVTDGARVSTRGDPGGTIFIRGGELTVGPAAPGEFGGSVDSGTTGATDGAAIAIDVAVDGTMVVENSEMVASSSGSGTAGDIRVVAKELEIIGEPFLLTGVIASRVFSSGDGGNITITADRVSIQEFAAVVTQVFGSGTGGDITMDVGSLELVGRQGLAFISTSTFAAGDAGNLVITADTAEFIGGSGQFTGLATQVSDLGQGGNAGTLELTAGSVVLLDGAQINAAVFSGSGAGGDIHVVADTILIAGTDPDGDPAGIFSTSESADGINFPSGDAGNISIEVGNLILRDRGQISTFAESFGNSGAIEILATDISVSSGAIIRATSFGLGLAGPVTIEAESITLTGPSPTPLDPFDVPFTGITSLSGVIGAGGGTITVTADRLEILDGAQINAQTTGLGDGGRIVVNADQIVISGFDAAHARPAGIVSDTSIFSVFGNFAIGRAGEIEITANNLQVSDRGVVSSLSSSFGDAGNVTIVADSVTFSGGALASTASTLPGSSAAAGTLTIDARLIEVLGGAQVSTSTAGSGPAGTVSLTGDSLRVADGTVSSSTSGTGAGGNVRVTMSGTAVLEGAGAGLLTESTSQADDAGAAGNVVLVAGELHIANGAVISATTRGPGAGGSIEIATAGATSLDGAGSSIVTDSTSTASGAGAAGSIALSAGALTLTQGASISASTQGPGTGGNVGITTPGTVLLDGPDTAIATESASAAPDAGTAGNITLSADTLQVSGGAEISTQSARADGGNIDIGLVSLLLLRDSRITTSVGTGEGGGGNITVGPVLFAVLDKGMIQANAFGGPGGNILIVANQFIATPDSVVEASSQLGVSGTVQITSPDTDVTTGVVVLSEALADAAARLAQQCGARGGRTLASFVGVGRGGLPVQPGPAMPSHYLASGGGKLSGGAAGTVGQVAGLPSGAVYVPATLQIECAT